jgi:phage-related protein
MSSIVNALTDLVSSFVELIWSFFTTAGDLVQKTAQFAIKFATEIVSLVVNFFRGLVDLAGGIVGFAFGKYSNVQSHVQHLVAEGRSMRHNKLRGASGLPIATILRRRAFSFNG